MLALRRNVIDLRVRVVILNMRDKTAVKKVSGIGRDAAPDDLNVYNAGRDVIYQL